MDGSFKLILKLNLLATQQTKYTKLKRIWNFERFLDRYFQPLVNIIKRSEMPLNKLPAAFNFNLREMKVALVFCYNCIAIGINGRVILQPVLEIKNLFVAQGF